MIKKTTCNNYDCPKIESCTIGYEDMYSCKEYMSKRVWNYKFYVKKCKEEGRKPLSINAYWYC